MDPAEIRVLHIDSERGWRGGQQQAAYLLKGMHQERYPTALVCQPGAAFENYCREQALPFHAVAMHGEADIFAGYRIAQICKADRIQILHLHSAHALMTGLWVKLFWRQVKLIGVRRVDFHIEKNFFSQLKYKNAWVDKLVCISSRIQEVMIEDGVDPEKLVTIVSGVDLRKFETVTPPEGFKAALGIPEHHLLVGTVAAMVDHKDYPTLLRAARRVIDQYDQVTFCAVGDGPDQESLMALARQLNLKNRFVFAGFREDVGNFLKSYDLFVLSSHMEGLGTSILDAMGVGLPVVACRAGGIPEAVKDGENGLLVPPRSSGVLAEAILILLRDRVKRIAYGKNAKEWVKRFAIEKTIRKNLKLYEAVLGGEDKGAL